MSNVCKFLIVDDNAADRLITRILLDNKIKMGEVIEFPSGKEVLNWLTEQESDPSECYVVILDIRMPGMDGFEFLSAYENFSEALKKVTHIFMLSSTLDPFDIERAQRNPNVISFLEKPIQPEIIERLMA